VGTIVQGARGVENSRRGEENRNRAKNAIEVSRSLQGGKFKSF